MTIAVIGPGARRQAVLARLRAEAEAPSCAHAGDWTFDGPWHDRSSRRVVDWSAAMGAPLVVPLSEQLLYAGVADMLRGRGIPAFGPSAAATVIERSKIFAKQLVQRVGFSTPPYRIADDLDDLSLIASRREFPMVIKEDGPRQGEGVYVIHSLPALQRARSHLSRVLLKPTRLLVEDFAEGPEYTVSALVGTRDFFVTPCIREYKRAYDRDEGPSTSGMGAYCPFTLSEDTAAFNIALFQAVTEDLSRIGRPYLGLLTANVILSATGPQVLEFNCHWGDPEAQSLLSTISGSFTTALVRATSGDRIDGALHVSDTASAWVTLVDPEYPAGGPLGDPLHVPAETLPYVFYYDHFRAPARDKGRRLISVGGVGGSLRAATRVAYRRIDRLTHDFSGWGQLRYRSDIGG